MDTQIPILVHEICEDLFSILKDNESQPESQPESPGPFGRFGFKARSILRNFQYVSILDTYDTQRQPM